MPLPPREVPAARERDGDERLCEQDPRRGDRRGQQIPSSPVEAEVPDGCEAVERTADDGDEHEIDPVVLRRDGTVEWRDLRERHDRPQGEEREEPAPEPTPVSEHRRRVGR
jgi:hypothetical protein